TAATLAHDLHGSGGSVGAALAASAGSGACAAGGGGIHHAVGIPFGGGARAHGRTALATLRGRGRERDLERQIGGRGRVHLTEQAEVPLEQKHALVERRDAPCVPWRARMRSPSTTSSPLEKSGSSSPGPTDVAGP